MSLLNIKLQKEESVKSETCFIQQNLIKGGLKVGVVNLGDERETLFYDMGNTKT